MKNHFLIRKGQSAPESHPSRRLFGIFLFLVLLSASFFFRYHISFLKAGAYHLTSCCQKIEESIQYIPALKPLYSFINPNFYKREQGVREILNVLEKNGPSLTQITPLVKLAEVIYDEATRNNQDPKFILALISIESSYQNWSVSNRGAIGLMQIMPYVAESIANELGIEWSGEQVLFNPFLNVKMGIYYVTKLLRDFKDPHLALTAYNYGPTYVRGLRERGRMVPKSFYLKLMDAYEDILLSSSRETFLPPEGKLDEEVPI